MSTSKQSVCCIAVIVLFCCFVYCLRAENFRTIDYNADRRELQQLFKDYIYYDYKNYDFNRIYDKEGDLLNNDIHAYVKSNNVLKYQNNNNFKTNVILDNTPLAEIQKINPDVAMIPVYTNYVRYTENPAATINTVYVKDVNKAKQRVINNLNKIQTQMQENFDNDIVTNDVADPVARVKLDSKSFGTTKKLYEQHHIDQYESDLNGAPFHNQARSMNNSWFDTHI